MFKKNLIIITVIFYGEHFVQGRLTNIVETDKGPVQGEIVKTVHNSSIEYSAFRAIPYAKPPIGELRFQVREIINNNQLLLINNSIYTRIKEFK